MELKLILSGVPKGESYWGPQEDKQYIGLLYKPSDVNHRFDIALHHNERGIYAYYQYLVYNTVNDYEGRTGSYFGITLRLDHYCKDIESIYQSLDMVYRKIIVGNYLVVTNGNRLKYNIMSLSDKDAENKKMEESIKSILSSVLNNNDMMSIPSVPIDKTHIKFNLSEVNQTEVFNAIGRNGFCSISDEYIGQKEAIRLKEEYNNGAKSRQTEIESLKQAIQSNETTIKELENECARVKAKEAGNQAVSDRVTLSHHHSSHHYGSHHRHKSTLSKNMLLIYVLAVMAIAGGVFLLLPEDDKPVFAQSDTQTESTLEQKNNDDIAEQDECLPDAEIDVENYSDKKGYMKGKIYSVTLNKVETVSSDSIDLELIGATKTSKEDFKFSILTDSLSDSVIMIFVKSTTPKQVIKRRIIKAHK